MDTKTTVIEAIEKRLEERDQQVVERRNTILQRLQTVAEKLPECFPSIHRIVIIGSVAEPLFFSMYSDVDIVIAGLENEDFSKAYSMIEELLEMEDIDLIREEEAPPLLMTKIKKGIVLYER